LNEFELTEGAENRLQVLFIDVEVNVSNIETMKRN
jgi:hypothetical protein